MRKIGFISYDNDNESTPKDKKELKESLPIELFRQFLVTKYETFGPNSSMVFRTSRELAYESREMCEPSLPDIATVMTDLGFKSDQFCGQWTWVLYDKSQVTF